MEFDRGYYSEDMFRYCVEHGHLCVMRLKEGINLSKKCNGDMISILQGTSKEGTSDVPMAIFETKQENQMLIERNTLAIMFPYFRSYVSTLTTQPGMTPIVLPAMNIMTMLAQKEK